MIKKALSNQLLKEADKVDAEMVKTGSNLAIDIENQRKVLPVLEKRFEKVKRLLQSLKFRIEEHQDKDGNFKEGTFDNPKFEALKEQYFEAMYEHEELKETIMMTEESISEGELLKPGGLPTEGAP